MELGRSDQTGFADQEFPWLVGLVALPPEILNLDMAALRTFRLVYQRGSFAAAANELGMNASSVSYTIERVRKAVGDALFVRQGGTVTPTDRCREVIEVVTHILEDAERLVDDEVFDPSKVEAEVRIMGSAFASQLIVPGVLVRLRREAPGIRLTMLTGYDGAREALLHDKVDMAIGPAAIPDSGIYGGENLIEDEHVCLMDKGHPMATRSVLTVEDFASAGHIRWVPVPGWLQAPFRHAEHKGLLRTPVAIASDVHAVGDLVAGTDLFAVLPSILARRWFDALALVPFDFPTPARTRFHWTAASHRSKVKAWVRDLIRDEARRLPSPMPGPAAASVSP